MVNTDTGMGTGTGTGTDSGWDGRGNRGGRGPHVTRNTPGARPAEAIPDRRVALPGRRVAAVSLVALAALATGCEPGTATGA
ncbi:HNH endonuclease, partial [Streptomyces parvus]|nr:HNH endonuclease [Streptomyces parvus]